MGRIVWTPRARFHLKEIGRYIGRVEQRRSIAAKNLREIRDKCRLYSASPEAGAPAPYLGEDYRTFTHKRWVIVYRPLEDGILVAAVFDGARDFARLFRGAE
jgi:plasmid stabilization system protein ParE